MFFLMVSRCFMNFKLTVLFLFQYLVERIHTNYALQVKTNDLCIIMSNVVRSYTNLMYKRIWMTKCCPPPFPYIFNWLWYSKKRSEYHSQLKMYRKGGGNIDYQVFLWLKLLDIIAKLTQSFSRIIQSKEVGRMGWYNKLLLPGSFTVWLY